MDMLLFILRESAGFIAGCLHHVDNTEVFHFELRAKMATIRVEHTVGIVAIVEGVQGIAVGTLNI
jgi:hypothetical protein